MTTSINTLFASAGIVDEKDRLAFIEKKTGLKLDEVADIYDYPDEIEKVRIHLSKTRQRKPKGVVPNPVTPIWHIYIKWLISREFDIGPDYHGRHDDRRDVIEGILGVRKDVEMLTQEEANSVLSTLRAMKKEDKSDVQNEKSVASLSETPIPDIQPTPKITEERFMKKYLGLNLIPAAMLFIAPMSLPYDYYTILRVVVFIFAIICIIHVMQTPSVWMLWPYLAIAILFNPVLPIHLSKGTWMGVDVIAGGIFVLHSFIPTEKITKQQA